MSVIAYIETPDGKFKKTGFEVASYAAQLAAQMNTKAIGVVVGPSDDPSALGEYGIEKVLHVNSTEKSDFDSQKYTKIISDLAKQHQAQVVILPHSANGKSLTGRLAVQLNAGSVSGVNSMPDLASGFVVKKSVYSGKAIASYNIETDIKVISIMGNSVGLTPHPVSTSVETLSSDAGSAATKVIARKTSEGIVPLPEAELVVSAGRGMKGPENWGIIEELAEVLNATTACSRPVADTGWRPHHEHVGQTGVAIRPNLYFAIGISGAIQHLAGVNNSKVIVVINKDPEAPFFKAADYGVVGDLFDVVPKLTQAIRKFKSA
jgi:electron transfer flavoprotein alpha subunit